jgi:hypothetical protein
LETVLKITEGGGGKIRGKKKKGKQHSGVLLHRKFPPERDTERQLFFLLPFSPSFLVVVKGDLILTFPNIRTGSSPCIVLWTLNLFSSSFFFPFFLCGVWEKRRETLPCKKEKEKERKFNMNSQGTSGLPVVLVPKNRFREKHFCTAAGRSRTGFHYYLFVLFSFFLSFL